MAVKNPSISTDSGLDVVVVLFNNAGKVYNGSGIVTYADADIASYALALTEKGTSGFYQVTFPSSLSNGVYHAVYYIRTGGVLALTAEKLNAEEITKEDTVLTPGESTGDTEAQYLNQLKLLQTAISSALQNPRPNYQVGQVRYNHADYIKMLFEKQKELKELMNMIPSEQIDTLQSELSEFGEDLIDYKNEPNL